DPRGQRDLVAEVAGEAHDAEPRVGLCGLAHELVGAVGAAVVDEDRLGVLVERVHDRGQPGRELCDDALFVEGGDDERVGRGHLRVYRRRGTGALGRYETQIT